MARLPLNTSGICNTPGAAPLARPPCKIQIPSEPCRAPSGVSLPDAPARPDGPSGPTDADPRHPQATAQHPYVEEFIPLLPPGQDNTMAMLRSLLRAPLTPGGRTPILGNGAALKSPGPGGRRRRWEANPAGAAALPGTRQAPSGPGPTGPGADMVLSGRYNVGDHGPPGRVRRMNWRGDMARRGHVVSCQGAFASGERHVPGTDSRHRSHGDAQLP